MSNQKKETSFPEIKAKKDAYAPFIFWIVLCVASGAIWRYWHLPTLVYIAWGVVFVIVAVEIFFKCKINSITLSEDEKYKGFKKDKAWALLAGVGCSGAAGVIAYLYTFMIEDFIEEVWDDIAYFFSENLLIIIFSVLGAILLISVLFKLNKRIVKKRFGKDRVK